MPRLSFIGSKNKKKHEDSQDCTAETSPQVTESFPTPKILLIDIPESCAGVLNKAGYNVTSETFGKVYKINSSSDYVPVDVSIVNDFYEKDIVILATHRPKDKPAYPKTKQGDGLKKYGQKCDMGLIDGRPLSMYVNAQNLNELHNRGAIFIVFVKQNYEINYYQGVDKSYGFELTRNPKSFDNWQWLEHLRYLNPKQASGDEISVIDGCGELSEILRPVLNKALYQTIFKIPSYHEEKWRPLAKNKYGEDVAGILVGGSNERDKRLTFVLPEMPNFDKVILGLLERGIASIKPELFPHLEASRWLYLPQYEIPKVTELKQNILNIEQKAQEEITNIEQEIERERGDKKDWYTLLQGTGDELVKAVIRALEQLGFIDVHDMDEENPADKREDIQIRDRVPSLIVDVKGVQGKPSDDESMQSEKHAVMRMREDQKNPTQIQALTIINSEKNLPPDKRDSQAYRPQIIGNARDKHVGLMTSWDICRILRNKDKLGWDNEKVKDIFYRIGRIDPFPSYYKYVGKVEKVWRDAFAIIPEIDFEKGSKLAVENEIEFIELDSDSIEINKQDVDVATKGVRCGIGYPNSDKVFKEKMRVFLAGPNA